MCLKTLEELENRGKVLLDISSRPELLKAVPGALLELISMQILVELRNRDRDSEKFDIINAKEI